MTTYVTLPRVGPDLDGLACAIAYAELLQTRGLAARAFIDGEPDAEAAYAAKRLVFVCSDEPPRPGDQVVLVDASDLRGMPRSLDPQAVVEVIDHRRHHTAATLFPNADLCIEPVGAAATLVAERFGLYKLAPSDPSAQLLQAAILSNTQLLKGSVTTERDRAAFQALASICPLPDGFVESQLDARRRAIVADLGAAITRERKDFDHPDGAYILPQLEFTGARRYESDVVPLIAALGERAMLNLVDVGAGTSAVIAPDPEFRAWVARRAALCFNGNIAVCPQILLRKQIVALLEGLG